MFLTSPFINLFRTKEEAMSFQQSPIDNFYNFNGVQLLPYSPYSYIQVTETPEGLNLEDWQVTVLSICDDKFFADVSANFMVEILTNSNNGDPQFYWSLTNIPVDCGTQLVYLKILQSVGETFYSTPFLLTAQDAEFTSLFHYRYDVLLPYQSIQLRSWFNQHTKVSELTTYYEISTHQTVSVSMKYDKLAKYRTELMSFEQLILMSDMLENPYTYVDLTRCNLYESVKIPEKQSQENFGEIDYQLSLKLTDKLNPNAIVPNTLPTTIITNVTAWQLANQIHYIELDITLPAGFTIVPPNSSSKIDKTTVSLTQISLGGHLYRYRTTNTPANSYVLFDWVYLINFKLVVSNGSETITYSIYPGTSGNSLVFNPTEVGNNTIKQLILNIS